MYNMDIGLLTDCIYHESLDHYEIWRVETSVDEAGNEVRTWTEHLSYGIPAAMVMDEVELLLEDLNLDKSDIEVVIETDEE